MTLKENVTGSLVGAFFDLDFTITSCDTFRAFLREHYLRNYKNWHFIPYLILFGILRKLRVISLQKFKERSLISLLGYDQVAIEKIGNQIFNERLKIYINKVAADRIFWHIKQNHTIFIITGSPDIYVKAFANFLDCNDYACSRLSYKDNVFCGMLHGKDLLGAEKLDAIKELTQKYKIDLSVSYAYSDHHSDLPMLNAVGNPVIISPTKNLRNIATKKKWPIFIWG